MLFQKGHTINKGKKRSQEIKQKIRNSLIGHLVSEESRRKISETKKNNKYIVSKETRAKLRKVNKGKILSEEHKQKISNSNKGREFSEEHKRNLSISHKGYHPTEEAKKNNSIAHRGIKSYLWKGGISFEPYTTDWTETLKRAIRERDNYICQVCSQYGNIVHHIDYNKKNCNSDNLVTLCNSCHTKTNHRREYWIKYFEKQNNE
jgi:hypothetical protein